MKLYFLYNKKDGSVASYSDKPIDFNQDIFGCIMANIAGAKMEGLKSNKYDLSCDGSKIIFKEKGVILSLEDRVKELEDRVKILENELIDLEI